MATKKASTVEATDGTAKINPALEVLARPVDSLRLDERNARKHERRSIDAIKTSLATYGQQKPIVALTSGVVIAGNGTLEAARELGWDRLAVVTFDTEDAARARAFAIMDNRTADLSTWDRDILAELLAEVPVGDAPLVGFTSDELQTLISLSSGDPTAGLTDESKHVGQYGVIVLCGDEDEQRDVYDRMTSEGFKCKVVAT